MMIIASGEFVLVRVERRLASTRRVQRGMLGGLLSHGSYLNCALGPDRRGLGALGVWSSQVTF